MPCWIERADHRAWLAAETVRLLHFGRASAHPAGGASPLDGDGVPDLDAPRQPYNTARVAHAYALGAMAGIPGCRPIAQAVFDGLRGVQRDHEHGGWFHEVVEDRVTDDIKSVYDHAHVMLAASTAHLAGLAGADEVLAEVTGLFVDRFFDADRGLVLDGFDRAFTTPDAYLGANANMHSVEAMLAAADATGDPAWLDRALAIATFFIARAREHEGRLPEHFTPDAEPLLDYNIDRPDDPFKPYGATIGHGLEWARLLLHLEAALDAAGRPGSAGLADAALLLFDRAVVDGWAVDGADGFVYTTDFEGVPVTRDRLWWVVAEGACVASALWRRTGQARFAERYAQWWDYLDTYVLDRERGSWIHSLTVDNQPDTGIWSGKPDLYHTVQATLIPRLPLWPGLGKAVADGLLA